MTQIYYLKDGSTKGPVTRAHLEALIQSGEISAFDRACEAGAEDWKVAGELLAATPLPAGEVSEIKPAPAERKGHGVFAWALVLALLWGGVATVVAIKRTRELTAAEVTEITELRKEVTRLEGEHRALQDATFAACKQALRFVDESITLTRQCLWAKATDAERREITSLLKKRSAAIAKEGNVLLKLDASIEVSKDVMDVFAAVNERPEAPATRPKWMDQPNALENPYNRRQQVKQVKPWYSN